MIKQFLRGVAKADFPDQPAAGVRKTSDVSLYYYGDIKKVLYDLQQSIINANTAEFGFDLFQVDDGQILFYNEYRAERNGEYGWHNDSGDSAINDSKLTALVNLSDEEYEGGDLQLFLNEEKTIDGFRIPGSVVIFPSFVQHRVTPVTKGTRTTLAQFVLGPKFR